MQDLRMSRKEESGSMEALATSELCSNSRPRRRPGNGKGECWPRDMSKIPAAKPGNMAILFQSEVSSWFTGKLGGTIRGTRLDEQDGKDWISGFSILDSCPSRESRDNHKSKIGNRRRCPEQGRMDRK